MNEISRTMQEVNDKIANDGNPVSAIIPTAAGHLGNPWGTAYSIGDVYYVVMGENTVQLTW